MDDPDIWRLAARLIKIYRNGAEMAASMYAENALAKSDLPASIKWKRIIFAIQHLERGGAAPIRKVFN